MVIIMVKSIIIVIIIIINFNYFNFFYKDDLVLSDSNNYQILSIMSKTIIFYFGI